MFNLNADYVLLLYCFPLLGEIVLAIFGGSKPKLAANVSTLLVWLSLFYVCLLGYNGYLTGINLVMALLIGFVSANIHLFSINYMDGDSCYKRYFRLLALITFSAYVMFTTDNIWLLVIAWLFSNTILSILIVHKEGWGAARRAGLCAFITLFISAIFLIGGAYLLTHSVASQSLNTINASVNLFNPARLNMALALITLAALVQSAQWPFHRWLMSSLNSPTPVSALMHAGLINAGGVLIAIFSPLYVKQPFWLGLIFIIGAVTAFIATYWKLIQPSIKRMLACSTMAQMGFMMMQCGLGFFSAAIAHLCWHGLFKSYLFLSSGSAVSTDASKNQTTGNPILNVVFSILLGIFGGLVFILVSKKSVNLSDTTILLVIFTFIASAQAALVVLKQELSLTKIFIASLLSMLVGLIYAATTLSIHDLVNGSLQDAAQRLTIWHWTAIAAFISAWLYRAIDPEYQALPITLRQKFYVWSINQSQPLASTITTKRQDYVA